MAPQRRKVGRPKATVAWSTAMGFRPYLHLDFRTDPAVHCLFYDNPAELNELIRRGLELAMQEKGLKYLDPEFQRSFAAKASGLGDTAIPMPGSAITWPPEPSAPTKEVEETSEPVKSHPPPAPTPSNPIPATVLVPAQPIEPLKDERPKAPAGLGGFLAKAIADGQ